MNASATSTPVDQLQISGRSWAAVRGFVSVSLVVAVSAALLSLSSISIDPPLLLELRDPKGESVWLIEEGPRDERILRAVIARSPVAIGSKGRQIQTAAGSLWIPPEPLVFVDADGHVVPTGIERLPSRFKELKRARALPSVERLLSAFRSDLLFAGVAESLLPAK
ncbi:MAG: hypothetical protein AAF517_21050 [Planctomycetota bacterium]